MNKNHLSYLIRTGIIEQYNGRWIKELGDGVMASFNTLSDAINAAIKLQQICNASKEFQLRIGIDCGPWMPCCPLFKKIQFLKV